ncbi:selenoneine biosynthesis selenosugar synthase SenB [Pseudoduganella umbonata]|uniref:Putative glycosyltransferase (TIGR04348 family) n=1 Tax=Pseudoduganella umbonata TaxID=864828 RepID=A0A4P8I0K5_9BURK|nr:selenoneine biosynthesis selenosugar synthase SenB [Pseudoduganella umbonata]MBB3221821.1 putative glycosyltransferase (TIGR04348 family) [Pseudoduganella umbonata]QCP14370.1 TIGR04348 family glycosyltransferase [Pseudoduganella umbonata]
MAASGKPSICIVSPGTARDNNGNWHTADRWAHFLRGDYDIVIQERWSEQWPAPDLLIALHARRSAPSLADFRRHYPDRPALLVLTGTDVYHDIHHDAEAEGALALADALVVLQPAALDELPDAIRPNAHVIYQSAEALAPLPGLPGRQDITMAGHLRGVKDPATFMRAAALVKAPDVFMQHIGAALDADLGRLAERTAADLEHYAWLGGASRELTRDCIRRSHALAICSTMEGGANVIVEAITSGVPVLASDISGNRGMLGDGYAGFFPAGDAAALARLIDRSVQDGAFLATLRAQCAARVPLFAPEAERAALLALVDNLLPSTPRHPIGKKT